MNKIYTEESVDAKDTEETETEKVGLTVYDEKGFELHDPDEHTEVDPDRPISKIIEYGEDLTTVVKVRDLTKKESKKKKSRPAKKAVAKKEAPVAEAEPMSFMPIHSEEVVPERPLKRVTFMGTFGRINAGYLDVYHQGMYLILVEDISAEFSYSPPQSDKEFSVETDGGEYTVIAPGIEFRLSAQMVKVTVLLKTGNI